MGAWSASTLGVIALFTAYVCYASFILRSFFVPKSAAPGDLCYRNLFDTPQAPKLHLRFYVSTEKRVRRAYGGATAWEVAEFEYTRDGVDTKAETLNVSIPRNVQQGRASLYAHVVVMPVMPDATTNPPWTMQATSPLTRWLPLPPPDLKYFLLNETKPVPPPQRPEDKDQKRLHWVPAIKMQMVWDFTCFSTSQVPGDVHRHFQFQQGHTYVPAVTIDEFHVRNDQINHVPINTTTTELELQVSLGPVSIGWWRMFANLKDSLEMMKNNMGADEKDTDDVRRMFTETSPLLLAVTMVVTLLHTLFDILAFKNDVHFWRERKTPEGLSLRGIVYSSFCQVIVLLYLIENESSFLVRISVALGLVIELWKLVRMWSMKDQMSEAAKRTEKADGEAGTWLLLVLSPCILGYAVYALLYERHTGWYGWLITSLYGLVFTLGFVAMTPQLFINYRMKSVDHMPWRTLIYRALNTFIDDLFAFIITMPTMHRLSTFRDDIVFFIFLYQRWIYPIDKTRTTEPGDDDDDKDVRCKSSLHKETKKLQ